MEKMIHQPVLLQETLKWVDLKAGDCVIDCTLGLAGHATEFLKKVGPTGKLMGLDWDSSSLKQATEILQPYNQQIKLINSSFADLEKVVKKEKFLKKIDLIFFDLGWSSWQLLEKEGFSFQRAEDLLDLRFDQTQDETAADLLNTASAKELARIFKEYGEEGRAVRLAEEIVLSRKQKFIVTVGDFLEIIARIIPRHGKIHPATKVWQALRIAVNKELDILPQAIKQAFEVVSVGGKVAIISFHSIEDRIVKQALKSLPKEKAKWLTKNVIKPTWAEQLANPRSRSAKLRVIQKI